MKIPYVQKLIDAIRGKSKRVFIENNISADKKTLEHLELHINGKGNTVEITEPLLDDGAKIVICIYGNNNKIIIEKGFHLSSVLEIQIGQKHPNFGEVRDASFKIGSNTSAESLRYMTYNSNTCCDIGRDCMFAYNIEIFNTDGHPIFDVNTKEVVNHVKGITIGEHSWIGRGAVILKNSVVPPDSIIGMNAVYSGNPLKKYGENISHCAFAGNPAKLIKQNITWDQNGAVCGYIENVG